MAIVCGTDFSLNSARAVRAAAALAARLQEPLVLVHVVEWVRTELVGDSPPGLNFARDRLARVAQRLRRRGLTVREEMRPGEPDEVLVSAASRAGARLIVVSSLGRRAPARWLLGSVAERTVQTSPVPVLVVRRTAGLRRWGRKGWPLRVVVGVDFSPTAEGALAHAGELRRLGPCDVIVAHSYHPPAERRRLGIDDEAPGAGHLEIERVLLRDLAAKVGDLPGEGSVRLRVEGTPGSAAAHLVLMAAEEGADLLVVGTHQRQGTSRLWHGSVSSVVLHRAPMSVLAVPAAVAARRRAPLPRLRRALAPTDFSDLADHAVRYAYAAVPAGGTVHLLHVVDEGGVQDGDYPLYDTGWPPTAAQRAAQEPELLARLRGRVPAEAEERGIHTEVEVVEGRTAAGPICAAAERLGADLICLGSHGRSGLATTLAGSVARAVIARSPRPVLVIRPPADA